jgi:GCK domain
MLRRIALLKRLSSTTGTGFFTRKVVLHPVSASLFWLAGISLSTTTAINQRTHCAGNNSTVRSYNKSRRPPTFGASIRTYGSGRVISIGHDSLSGVHLKDRENCPVCEKYSRGPCGKLFQTWLQCTDNHPGKDSITQEDLHLSKCATFAKALAECLDRNEAYYESPISEQLQDESSEELQLAWEQLIDEDLTPIPRKEFPKSHRPKLEFRPKDRLAVIFVDLQNIQTQSLLLAFVQDVDSQVLLSAGSLDDLFVFPRDGKDTGVLQCTIPETTNQIVVSCMYEGEGQDQNSVIYTYTAKVPKA